MQVAKNARIGKPAPATTPIAATTQIVAADVSPVTRPPPEDAAGAEEADAGDDLRGNPRRIDGRRHPSRRSRTPTVMYMAAPMQMRMFVRKPAGLFRSSRSRPTIAPQSAAAPQRTMNGSEHLVEVGPVFDEPKSFIGLPAWLCGRCSAGPATPSAARSSRRSRVASICRCPVSASSASGHGRDAPIASVFLSRSPAAVLP